MEKGMRKSRVLVCGSRTWGVTDPDDVDPWRPTKPQFDHTSLEALMTIEAGIPVYILGEVK